MNRFSKAIGLALLVFTMIFALVGCSTAPKQDLGDIVVADVPVAEEPAQEAAPAAEEPAPAEETAPVAEEPVAEAPVEEAPVEEAPVEEAKIVRTINVYGYEATLELNDNVVDITYPSFITFAEIQDAAAVAYATYQDYLAGSMLTVDAEAGTAVLTLAAAPSEEDFNYAADVLEKVLPVYVASLFEEAEPVSEVVVATEEPAEVAEVAEVEEEEEVLSASISLFGYEASITYENGIVVIDYPDFITSAEIKAAAEAAYAAYSQYLEGSELVIDDGFATLKLAFKIGKEEFTYAVNLLQSELSYYVATVLGAVDEVVEAVEEAKAEEEKVEEVVETVAEAVPEILSSVVTCFGQNVQISAEGNTVVFTYPSFITSAEVAAAAKAAYEAYSPYLQGSALYIDSAAGTAVLTLAYDLTEADFDYAVGLLESELNYYVASLFKEEAAEEVVEVVTEVAEAITEALTKTEETPVEEAPAEEPAPVEEAPAEEPAPVEEAPAAEPAKEETPAAEAPATEPAKEEAPATEPAKEEVPATKPATTTTTTTTTTAEPAKKSNAGVIVLIVVLVAVAAAAVVLFLKKKKN